MHWHKLFMHWHLFVLSTAYFRMLIGTPIGFEFPILGRRIRKQKHKPRNWLGGEHFYFLLEIAMPVQKAMKIRQPLIFASYFIYK